MIGYPNLEQGEQRDVLSRTHGASTVSTAFASVFG